MDQLQGKAGLSHSGRDLSSKQLLMSSPLTWSTKNRPQIRSRTKLTFLQVTTFFVPSICSTIDLSTINSKPTDEDQTSAKSRTGLLDVAFGVFVFLAVVFAPIIVIFQRVADMVGRAHRPDVAEGQMRVPTFFACQITESENNWIMIATSIIGAVFGGIHLFAWDFVFPSQAETTFWRISSALITGIPVAALVTSSLNLLKKSSDSGFIRMVSFVGGRFSFVVLMLGVPVYVLARLSLLTEAFIALCDL